MSYLSSTLTEKDVVPFPVLGGAGVNIEIAKSRAYSQPSVSIAPANSSWTGVVTLKINYSDSYRTVHPLDYALNPDPNPAYVSGQQFSRLVQVSQDHSNRPNIQNLSNIFTFGPFRMSSIALDAGSVHLGGQQVFKSVQALYQSCNNPSNRQIADRLTALYRDALAEGEGILDDSLRQFTDFFLTQSDLRLPKITLTPDNTLRVRWIHGEGNFTAIEFIGHGVAKLVAEIPRERGVTARYFVTESIDNIVSIARANGASFR